MSELTDMIVAVVMLTALSTGSLGVFVELRARAIDKRLCDVQRELKEHVAWSMDVFNDIVREKQKLKDHLEENY